MNWFFFLVKNWAICPAKRSKKIWTFFLFGFGIWYFVFLRHNLKFNKLFFYRMIRMKTVYKDVDADVLYDVLHDPDYRKVGRRPYRLQGRWWCVLTDYKDGNGDVLYDVLHDPDYRKVGRRSYRLQGRWRCVLTDNKDGDGDVLYDVLHVPDYRKVSRRPYNSKWCCFGRPLQVLQRRPSRPGPQKGTRMGMRTSFMTSFTPQTTESKNV